MAVLKITSGALSGQTIEITQDEVSIGRSTENTITLDDPSVSGYHCTILRDGQRYSLRDLGSTNGTTVNGVSVRNAHLRPGAVVSVGTVEMTIAGDDVAVEDIDLAAGTGGSPLRPATVRTEPIGEESPFGTRRDSGKRLWAVVITIVIILAAAAAGWFIAQLVH
jgi:predicted component of type VI protein secretion system